MVAKRSRSVTSAVTGLYWRLSKPCAGDISGKTRHNRRLIAAISSYARYLGNVTLAAATATERLTLDAIRL
jgi:hypothetical protein